MEMLNHVNDPSVFMAAVSIDEFSEKVGGFISSIRIIQNCITSQSMTGPQVFEEVADLFTPGVIFSPDIQARTDGLESSPRLV